MKSKISKFLMLCAVTIGMGLSVTSCKDTAEDLYNELYNEIWGDATTSGQGLKDQVDQLSNMVDSLKTALAAINSCDCDTAAINSRITQLETALAAIRSCGCDTAAINQKLRQLEAQLGAKVDTTAMKAELANLKTYVSENYVAKTVYQTAITNLQNQIDAIETCACDPTIPGRLSAAETAIIEAKNKAEAAKTAADNAKAAADAAKTAADNAKAAADAAKSTADAAKTAADAANALATAADSLSKSNQTAINTINQTINIINNRIASMGDSLKTAYDRASSAEARSYADSIRIDELIKRVTDVEKDSLQKLATQIADVRQLAIDNLAAAKAYTDQETAKVREELGEAIDATNTRIDELIKAYKAVDRALQAQIDDLDERMGKVEDLLDGIDTVLNRLNKIEELLGRLVTGVIVQGAYNPVFGALRLPTGLNTQVLLAVYGEATNDIYFPTQRTGNYVRAEEALTAKDMQILGLGDDVLFNAGTTLIGEEGANAGKLYLTVNPANVDFTGLNISLVNSQDKESVIKLGEVKKSDEVLKFGYTRAANNGFYEVPAYVSADDIENVQKVNFNKTALKNAVNEIVKKRTNANFKGIASDMYDLLMGMSLDANAVKVSRKTDANGDSAIYSNYDIAATAVKPLSFESYKDLNVVTIPGYERAMSLIDRLAKEVKDKVHVAFNTVSGSELAKDIQALNITKIEIKDLTPEQLAMFEISIDTTIVIDGLKRTISIDKDIEVPIKIHTSQNVTVPGQVVTVPSVHVDANGVGTLVVPVNNEYGTKIGTASIDLGTVNVSGNTTSTTVTIGSKTITVPINYESTETVHISMSQIVDFSDDGTGKKSIKIWITRDMKDAANSLWGTVKDQLGNVNGMLDDLNDVVDDANDLLDDLRKYESKVDNTVNSYVDRVKNIIENLNNRVAKLINSTNKIFQPTMFIDDAGTSRMLSMARNMPTVVGSSVTLVPTTWCLETLAPVCRKHIAVTNVFNATGNAQDGNGECLSALNAANKGDLNKVIDGNKREIKLSGLQSGLTYEVAYSALDFHGKISTKKYYVTVE